MSSIQKNLKECHTYGTQLPSSTECHTFKKNYVIEITNNNCIHYLNRSLKLLKEGKKSLEESCLTTKAIEELNESNAYVKSLQLLSRIGLFNAVEVRLSAIFTKPKTSSQ